MTGRSARSTRAAVAVVAAEAGSTAAAVVAAEAGSTTEAVAAAEAGSTTEAVAVGSMLAAAGLTTVEVSFPKAVMTSAAEGTARGVGSVPATWEFLPLLRRSTAPLLPVVSRLV